MNTQMSPDELARFRRLPPSERRKLASDILGAHQGLLVAAVKTLHEFIELNSMVAYVGIKQQLEENIIFWRREMQRAAWDSKNKNRTTGAGRSPAIKAHGCAALASSAGSLLEAFNRSGNARKVTA
jgi:hypothetical protein